LLIWALHLFISEDGFDRFPWSMREPQGGFTMITGDSEQAGHSQLMTSELIQPLAVHSLNNLRVLNPMAAEMLAAAAERNLPRLDEELYFELFSPAPSKHRRNKAS